MDVPEKVETEVKSPYREVLKKKKRPKNIVTAQTNGMSQEREKLKLKAHIEKLKNKRGQERSTYLKMG